MLTHQLITPFLWFNDCAEEAVAWYVNLFPDSSIQSIQRYTEAGREIHQHEPGTAMVVEFRLAGQPFIALNGGPRFSLTEAISFVITCESQAEVDTYWSAFAESGREMPCGWITDKFGITWQVVPKRLKELLTNPQPGVAQRVTAAFMTMTKFDIAALELAAQLPSDK